MRMEQVELPNDILKIKLQGSLDIAGAGEIDMPFSVISGSRKKVIVDLGQVTFLARSASGSLSRRRGPSPTRAGAS
jgi:anti-anti-sigma regulatory factor